MSANYVDPFSVWKSFYNEMEPKLAQSMHKMLESEEYAAASGQLLNAALQMEQYYAKMVEKLLENYKIPSIKDFARLGELLVGLESKVDLIDERLASLEKQGIEVSDLKDQITALSNQLEMVNQNLLDAAKAGDSKEGSNRQRKSREAKGNTDTNEEKAE
ncbi:hypothetical protein [Effusibacillus consociatus]|uniref:Poly(3-hydroxyalkanoate) polymerase subunit PhaE n=1 Tax=Effusibacillus consociatus TaxID=1117041 RepID=A0ABV9Q8Z2_9BACL